MPSDSLDWGSIADIVQAAAAVVTVYFAARTVRDQRQLEAERLEATRPAFQVIDNLIDEGVHIKGHAEQRLQIHYKNVGQRSAVSYEIGLFLFDLSKKAILLSTEQEFGNEIAPNTDQTFTHRYAPLRTPFVAAFGIKYTDVRTNTEYRQIFYLKPSSTTALEDGREGAVLRGLPTLSERKAIEENWKERLGKYLPQPEKPSWLTRLKAFGR